MTKYEFNVDMHCEGCKKAVNAVLTKVPGVTNIQIDLEKQSVSVEGTADQNTVFEAIKKTGKKCTIKQ